VRLLAVRKMCEYERAYGGLYLERLSFEKHINYLKLSVKCTYDFFLLSDFSKTFGMLIFFQDFSRPGNNYLKMP